MTAVPTDSEAVLGFWFAINHPGSKDDARIRVALGDLHARALAGALDDWAEVPSARLALVILLDQVSRHLYRDRPEAFAGDLRAQALTARFLERSDWAGFTPRERYYAAVPWLHAEDLAKQERVHTVMHALALEDPALRISALVADLYLETIRRFGRFPHRNAILGRESTAEEIAFLAGEWKKRRRAMYREEP